MGAGAAGLVLTGVSAGLGAARQKKLRKKAKKTAGRLSALGAMAVEESAALKEQVGAAEAARLGVYGLLGKPGTYGPGAPVSGILPAGLYGPGGEKSAFAKSLLWGKESAPGQFAAITEGARKGILNPEEYAKYIAGTTPFQIQSRQVAEAEQLLAREGPAWERLENSTLGTIFEQTALQEREQLRNIKNDMAKGGSVRRSAYAQAKALQAHESAMQTRVQQTWDANLRLFDKVNAYVKQVQEGTGDFMETLPLVRDSYIQTLQENTRIMQSGLERAIAGEFAAWKAYLDSDGPGMLENIFGALGGALMGGGGLQMGLRGQAKTTEETSPWYEQQFPGMTSAARGVKGIFTPKTAPTTSPGLTYNQALTNIEAEANR